MILSIDWDFFVPENLLWDLGHSESQFFLRDIWGFRGSLVDEIKTSGAEVRFWEWLRNHFWINTDKIHVSESHLSIMKLIEFEIGQLLLFDAHHDCWPMKPDEESGGFRVGCESWGTWWLQSRNPPFFQDSRQLVWIKPDWFQQHLHDVCDLESAEKGLDIVEINQSDFPDLSLVESDEIDLVHVCRSGCWTPPWLDHKFNLFVGASGLEPTELEEPPWDGLRPRWTEDDLRASLEKMKKDREVLKQLQQLQEGR